MSKTSVKTIGAIFAIAVLLVGVLFLRFWLSNPKETPTLTIGSTVIDVTLAQTPEEQEQGLSDTLSLPKNAGKLFLFDAPGNYGFWMKDMHYPLDIIWIDTANTIIGITKDVSPKSYPTVFYPPARAQSVLEVNAGFSTQYGIHIGQTVVLKK